MGCEAYREALSARLDSEDGPDERAGVDAHLATCLACRRWLDAAATITRLARTGAVVAAPGISDSVLDALPGPRRRYRQAVLPGLRIVLGVLGAVQLLLGALQSAGRSDATTLGGEHLHPGSTTIWTPDHLWNESAAWNLALGAGFLWIALRRGRPVGMLPTLTAFVLALTLLSITDLSSGQVNPTRLYSHGFVVLGYLIVLALSRLEPAVDAPPGNRHPGIRQPDLARTDAPGGIHIITQRDDEVPGPSRRHGPAAAA